jgi:hypothetical protein
MLCISLIISGCDLQHLDLALFTKVDHLTPKVYLPIASGDYLIKDFVSIPESGNIPVTTPAIKFRPIIYDLSGLEYSAEAVDSVFLVVKTINSCPMQLRYSITFEGVTLDSNELAGAALDASGHVKTPAEYTSEFFLSLSDFRKLSQAANLTLSVTLTQPKIGPVIANELINGKIWVKIAYRASLNLLKL